MNSGQATILKLATTILLVVLQMITVQVYSQSEMTVDMFSTLEQMNLEYLQPVEETPKYIRKGKIKYFDYDFGMKIDNGNTLILVQTRLDDGNYIPQVAISALVATLATNDQDVDIRMMEPSDTYLSDTNSDWAIEALFKPKDGIGNYGIAYLKSIFKEGLGVTNILYLAKENVEITPILRYKD